MLHCGFAGCFLNVTERLRTHAAAMRCSRFARCYGRMKLEHSNRAGGDDNVRPWKQLYQQYTLRADNLTDITDISVTK